MTARRRASPPPGDGPDAAAPPGRSIGEAVNGWLAQRGIVQRRLVEHGLGSRSRDGAPAGGGAGAAAGAPRPGPPGVEPAPGSLPPGAGLALGPLVAVVACWPAVAGAELARHARPVRVEGDVLVVAVDEPGLVAELGFRSSDLLAGLARCAGAPVANRCKVIVRGTLGLE